jgi:hypothetical protein
VAKVKIVWDFLSQHVDFLEREFVRCDWEICNTTHFTERAHEGYYYNRLVFNSAKPLNLTLHRPLLNPVAFRCKEVL